MILERVNMLISKMIKELEELKKLKGDVEIYYDSEVGIMAVETISNIRVGFSDEDAEECVVIF